MSGLTEAEREALRSRVELNWPFEVDATTADEIRDIADGVAVEVERLVADRAERKVAAVQALGEGWIGFDDSHHYGDAVLMALGAERVAALTEAERIADALEKAADEVPWDQYEPARRDVSGWLRSRATALRAEPTP